MKSILLTVSAGLARGLGYQTSGIAEEGHPVLGLGNVTRAGFSTLRGRRLTGPFMGVDFPDPGIIWGDGSWKAYGTSSNGKKVPIATSSDDISSWTLTGVDGLPDPGPWVDKNDQAIWAPDVQKNDDGVYVMYYTARQASGTRCIGVATSPSALGPFAPRNTPLICDTAGGGVIDASGYDDGTDRWILWKVDGNNLGGATTCQAGTPSGEHKPTPIKIQRMARDALTLLGSPKTILDNGGAANDGVVEAPALYKIADGNYVLFYSTHCFSSDDYDIEYAFSSIIDGPYTDRRVLLRTADNKGIYGPGGLDIDPNGMTTVVFHGRMAQNQGNFGKRELYSATLTINGRLVAY